MTISQEEHFEIERIDDEKEYVSEMPCNIVWNVYVYNDIDVNDVFPFGWLQHKLCTNARCAF